MKSKGQLSPVPSHKTPTTPIRSARSNTYHHKQNPSVKSNCSMNFKNHKVKDSDISERQKEKDKTTVANTNVNTHIKEKNSKNEHNTIDQILHRISSNSGRSNSSLTLYKKTQINSLRELMEEGKKISKLSSSDQRNKYENNTSFLDTQSLQSLKLSISRQLKDLFSLLRKNIQKKEEQLLDSLEHNIFQLKQSMINKCYQKVSLSRGIEQCEKDINQCYDKIVQELSVEQFKKVINAYSERFIYYIQKIQKQPQIKLQYPPIKEIVQKINEVKIELEQSAELTFDMTKYCSKIANNPNQNTQIEPNKSKMSSIHSAVLYL